jgi:hypothetical protein
MRACQEDLKDARDHLRKAASAMQERILGRDLTHHLRQSLRSVLKAGISAIDDAEQITTTPTSAPDIHTSP